MLRIKQMRNKINVKNCVDISLVFYNETDINHLYHNTISNELDQMIYHLLQITFSLYNYQGIHPTPCIFI